MTSGTYHVSAPLANITIAGLKLQPRGVQFRYNYKLYNNSSLNLEYSNGTAYITDLAQYTPKGVFEDNFQLTLTY